MEHFSTACNEFSSTSLLWLINQCGEPSIGSRWRSVQPVKVQSVRDWRMLSPKQDINTTKHHINSPKHCSPLPTSSEVTCRRGDGMHVRAWGGKWPKETSGHSRTAAPVKSCTRPCRLKPDQIPIWRRGLGLWFHSKPWSYWQVLAMERWYFLRM